MKIRLLIFLLLSTALLFSGCSKKNIDNGDSPEDIFNTSHMSSENGGKADEDYNLGDYDYGYTIANRNEIAEYSGNDLICSFYYNNHNDKKMEAGLIAVLDGIIQPFSVIKDGNLVCSNVTMYSIALTGNESVNFDVVFSPITGNKGDVLGLYFHSLMQPSFGPTNDKYPHYGVYHKSAIAGPQKLRMNVDCRNQNAFSVSNDYTSHEITEELRASHKGLEGDDSYLDNNTVLEIANNNDYLPSGQRFIGQGTVSIFMRGFGGDTIMYRTAVFVDHKQIKLNGADYVEYTIEKGKASEFNFLIDLGINTRYSTFYTITTPVGQDYLKENAYPVKSQSTLLVNELIAADPNETALEVAPKITSSDDLTSLNNETDITSEIAIPTHTENQNDFSEKVKNFKDGIQNAIYLDNDRLIITTISQEAPNDSFGFGLVSTAQYKLNIVNNSNLSVINTTNYISGYQSLGKPQIYPDKILVAGHNATSNVVDLIIFDRNLNLINTVHLSDIMNIQIMNAENVKYSIDGNKVISCDGQKVVCYDLKKYSAKTIFEISGTSLSGIDFVEYCNNDRYLAFYGYTPYEKGESNVVYGVINLESKKVTSFTNTTIDTAIQITEKMAFWDEKSLEYGQASSGKVYIIDYSLTNKTFDFEEKQESQNAYVSPDGKIIVSFVKNFDANITKVKVYDIDSRTLKNEFSINETIVDVIFSPDSSRFTLSCWDTFMEHVL
ncbi:hypothetical protein FACS1894105_04090 [Clostridia bacterium]|nr:hypothetical protein FACS1894105_04090 [Clostridia bacterium]